MSKIAIKLKTLWHKLIQINNYDIYSYDDFCLLQVVAFLKHIEHDYKLRIITSPVKLAYKVRFFFDGGQWYHCFMLGEGKLFEYKLGYMEEDLRDALRLKPGPLRFTEKYGINTFIFATDFDKDYDYSTLDVVFETDKYVVCVPPGRLKNEARN